MSEERERKKKKRRWDVAAPEAEKSVHQVIEAIAQAPLDPSIPQVFERDIEINSSPARSFLTKGQAHKDLLDQTGAIVVVRGVYHPPHMPVTDPNNLLRLHIEAKTKKSLEAAVEEIERIMREEKAPTTFSDKVFADLPEELIHRAKGKIVGPGGQFVKYIQRKANCRVQLRGRGSGYKEGLDYVEADEPLHLHVVAPNEEALESGRKQCEDLLKHVREEMNKMLGVPPPSNYQPPPPSGYYAPSTSHYPPPPATAPPPPPGSAPPPPPPGSAPPPPTTAPPPPPPGSAPPPPPPGSAPPPPTTAPPPPAGQTGGEVSGNGYGYQGYTGNAAPAYPGYQYPAPSTQNGGTNATEHPKPPLETPAAKRHKSEITEPEKLPTDDPLDPASKSYNHRPLVKDPQQGVSASLKRQAVPRAPNKDLGDIFNFSSAASPTSQTTQKDDKPFWQYDKDTSVGNHKSVFDKLDEISSKRETPKPKDENEEKYTQMMRELEADD